MTYSRGLDLPAAGFLRAQIKRDLHVAVLVYNKNSKLASQSCVLRKWLYYSYAPRERGAIIITAETPMIRFFSSLKLIYFLSNNMNGSSNENLLVSSRQHSQLIFSAG